MGKISAGSKLDSNSPTHSLYPIDTNTTLTMNSTAAPPTSAVDENGSATDASAAGFKAYVPVGDQRLVLSAIDNQVNAAKDAWREKNNAAAGATDKSNNHAAREEFFMNCIEQTGASLKRQLESVTIPADEAEVERVLDSFQTRLLKTRPSTDEDDDEDSLSSEDDENEEIEFDDNEIVDQDAYNQVKSLRAQARELSARVIATREETVGKALNMTRRDLTELLRVHGFSENGEDEAEASEQAEENEELGTEKRDSLNPMNTALQTLTSSLQNVDSGLAERLESLKETIGTIDSSVDKYQRMSQGDESALSQTEKALLSSANTRENEVEFEEEDTDSPMNPDKKLATLLAGVL